MPNSVVQFLSLDEVIELHAIFVERFGGPAGVRDLGLPQASTLYRPESGYYSDLDEMAAAMVWVLIKKHPFVMAIKEWPSLLLRCFCD